MILSVYLALPDIDNRRRSMKITEGVRAAKASGRWLGRAPFGYENSTDDQKKPIIIPGKNAAIVKQIFKDILAGKTQAEVRYNLCSKGTLISRAAFSKLLRNKIYIGQVYVKSDTGNQGFFVRGLHQPLVSQDLFNKVQEKIDDNFTIKKLPKAKSFRPELYLRGLIVCDNCSNGLTGSASRSETGKRHFYYHCNHCKTVRLKADEVHERVLNILNEIKLEKTAKALYELILK
jgi:site-specific DNA recombinase